jgi:hypothetical protein
MSVAPLLAAGRFLMPKQLAEQCIGAMRERGRQGDELFIALAGVCGEGEGEIVLRRALIPEQTCHHTPEGLLVTIEGDAIFALSRRCHELGEMLVGQIHAHPTDAYHSGADDQLALVRLPGSLSIVVADFARGPLRPRSWSVHRRDGEGRWRPLPRDVALEVR